VPSSVPTSLPPIIARASASLIETLRFVPLRRSWFPPLAGLRIAHVAVWRNELDGYALAMEDEEAAASKKLSQKGSAGWWRTFTD
jgi:hypothetical protein